MGSWVTVSPCPFIPTFTVFPPLIFRSRPSPRSSLCLLLHIPLQNSTLACSPLPGQLLTMWSTCWWKNQLVKPTFFFSLNRKTLTGYLKSCRNCQTQSPMIWLKCSLSNCLCGCCVDKTQTNYSVGRWLSAQQQSVGVMDRRCSQMGSLGRGNQRCCPLNPGLYLLLVKAPKKIAALASWQHTEVNRASTLGTAWTSLHSACLCNVFITYQNFVFLITRLIEVSMECHGGRRSSETNKQPHTFINPLA